jgi:hypothetical protein
MIARMWHGWTKPQNADAYEDPAEMRCLQHALIQGRKAPLARRVAGDG